jgi:hypothetical protein
MPVYPDDYGQRLRALELRIDRLYTASQMREPYARLVARQMVVGNDAPSRRIVFNPDDAPSGSAEISMVPAGSSNATRIIADTDGSYSGEAVLHLVSGEAVAGDSELKMASGEVFMQIRDTSGSADGGYAYWGRSQAVFGFRDGSSDNYFNFSASGVSRHYGQWDDFGSLSSDAGLLWGSVTTNSGNDYTIFYPSSMDSNMGPIIGFRPANTSPLVSWQITASNTSSVSFAWSGGAQSAGVYLCSFRH